MRFLAEFLKRMSKRPSDTVDFSHPQAQTPPNQPVDEAAPANASAAAAASAASQTPRPRANRTRLLGFDPSQDLATVDEDMPLGEAAPARPGRQNRTRLLGFDHSAAEEPQEPSNRITTLFPVGFVLVTKGPGRGNCFGLSAGMSQIGRGGDQAIQLDFGDEAISRQNHAAIVFDSDTGRFVLSHGGKTNIVRLNNEPVLCSCDLSDGDAITIGKTQLTLKMICDDAFDWSEPYTLEEQGNVAIA